MILKVLADNIGVYVEGSITEVFAVKELLTVMDEGAKYTPAYRTGIWDGNVCFLKHRIFPTGLLPRVIQFLHHRGMRFKLIDEREVLPVSSAPRVIGDKKLRDYQYGIADVLLQQTVGGLPFPRGIIAVATNAGKSLIAAAIISGANVPVIYLCHRQEILKQIYEWYCQYFGESSVGIISSKEWKVKKITIAMVTTLYSRRKSDKFKQLTNYFRMVIVDEAHHAPADSWAVVINQFHQAYFRVALSGTARYELNKIRRIKLKGMFGRMVGKGIDNKELVRLGVSATPTIILAKYDSGQVALPDWYESRKEQISSMGRDMYIHPSPQLEREIRTARLELHRDLYDACIIHNEPRCSTISSIIRGLDKGSVVLIIVNNLSHGRFLRDKLKVDGIDSVFISGDDSTEVRIRVKHECESRKQKVVITTMIWKEGVDIPSIDVLIYACGGKAPHTVLQFFGRGLRRSENKTSLVLYDFVDRYPMLLDHSKKREGIYRDNKFEVEKIVFPF